MGSVSNVPRRSAVAKESSDDTTFYGHSIPEVTVRARAARSTRRTSIPVPSNRFGSTHLIGDPYPAPSGPVARPAPLKRASPPATLSLLPALALRPTESTYSANLDAGARSDSSGNEDLYAPPSPSPNRRSFRAPSPARFRDFVESESASSSPEKNARGLPQPGDGSPRSDFGASPKKRAMGPEQIIGMVEDSADGEYERELCQGSALTARLATEGIVEARGATTDLAALLSDLEETQDLTASGITSRRSSPQKHRDNYGDLSASLRQHLPIIAKVDSVESLRSTVSDVPDDLRLLIRSVSDHISEMDEHSFYGRVEEEHDQSPFAFGDGGLGSPFGDDSDETSEEEQACFDDNEDHAPFGSHHFGTTDDFLDVYAEGSGGSTTGPLSSASPTATSSEGEIEDSTAESFEGHISTAAMALRAMLNGSEPGERAAVAMIEEELEKEDDEEEHSRLRDSVRDYLEMERPTVSEDWRASNVKAQLLNRFLVF